MGLKRKRISIFRVSRQGLSIELAIFSILFFGAVGNQVQRQLSQEVRILKQEKCYWEQRGYALKMIKKLPKMTGDYSEKRNNYHIHFSHLKRCYYVQTPDMFYFRIYLA